MIRKIVKLFAEEYLTPGNIRKISHNSNVSINNRELNKQEIESLLNDIKDAICNNKPIVDSDSENQDVNIRFEKNNSK